MSMGKPIGGPVCAEQVGKGLIASEPGPVPTSVEMRLWRVVEQIGRAWEIQESTRRATQSQFRECVRLKAGESPSYLGEYESAVLVLDELEGMYGVPDAFDRLFFNHGIPEDDVESRLFHLKTFVVNELISVVVVSGGFRAFGARNYKGYIGGSRFRLEPPYRTARGQS